MSRLILLAAGLLAWLPLAGQSSEADRPGFEAVFQKFYSEYRFLPADNRVLHFASKPDGWYLIETPYGESQQVLRDEIFWSEQTNSYLPLRYPKQPLDQAPQVAFHRDRYFSVTPWSAYGYERCRYYGYAGWEADMVRELAQDSLSSRDLEGLARAYSSLASRLLHAPQGISHPGYEPLGYERLADSSRTAAYLDTVGLALVTYAQLRDRDSSYETMVGPVQTKYSNEHLTAWYDLQSVQRPDLARQFLQAGLYDGFFLRLARYTLEACPPEAVLLTNGDNDTYPLLYLQQQMGIRPDVQIVNRSLLNTHWYAAFQIDSTAAHSGLDLTLSPSERSEMNEGYLIVDPDKPVWKVPLPGGQTWELPTRRSGQQRYLLISEYVLGKWLLQQRQAEMRPLCVAYTVNPGSLPGLVPHLSLAGPVYRLSGKPPLTTDPDPLNYVSGHIDQAALTAFVEARIAEGPAWYAGYRPDSETYGLWLSIVLRQAYHGLYGIARRSRDSARSEFARQEDRNLVLAWLNVMEPLRTQLGGGLAQSMAELAALAYLIGDETTGLAWENQLYNVLDAALGAGTLPDDPGQLPLAGLRWLGYFFQETGRDPQASGVEEQLNRYLEP